MRFSLIDLLIAIAIEGLSMGLVLWGAHWMGFGRISGALWLTLTLTLGVVLYLLITPPIYRRLRMFPLFLPVCPYCKRRPGSYRFLESAPLRFVVACSNCERTMELWLERPAAADISTTMPSLLWSWPQSIGRWRSISRGESE
jgi:hypothetical protein